MSFENYPKRTPREKYSGMWGRIGYLLTRRSTEELVQEVNSKDDVWRAAAHMGARKRDVDMTELSDIETDAWLQAIRLATDHTVTHFIENETSEELLMEILEREVETGNPDTDLISLINQRLQELRA